MVLNRKLPRAVKLFLAMKSAPGAMMTAVRAMLLESSPKLRPLPGWETTRFFGLFPDAVSEESTTILPFTMTFAGPEKLSGALIVSDVNQYVPPLKTVAEETV